jgi:gas vesicle protein
MEIIEQNFAQSLKQITSDAKLKEAQEKLNQSKRWAEVWAQIETSSELQEVIHDILKRTEEAAKKGQNRYRVYDSCVTLPIWELLHEQAAEVNVTARMGDLLAKKFKQLGFCVAGQYPLVLSW